MRTHIRIVAALALAAICTCAAGQGVTQTGNHVNFTFTEIAMRVPVSLPLSNATGTVGPNVLCFTWLSETVTANNPQYPDYVSPADLKAALLNKVYGKSIQELNNLIAAVANASGRDARLLALFGIKRSSGTAPFAISYALSTAQRQQLQMGQEVSGPDLTRASQSEIQSIRCYAAAQMDQAIDVGVGVVATIIDNIDNLARSGKPPAQTPQ